MNRILLALAISLFILPLLAQQRVNGNFSFQTDPSKDYSIYIPSSYNLTTPNKLMLGLHPLNTARWNGTSWCDTLIAFAEANNLLLVCPDGGVDGRIDDPIDTAFTTALLDSMKTWYNVDINNIYAMGFSWGARTTYTYGLNRPSVFGGYLAIGAAITRTNEVNVPLQLNSNNKPIYIIHGSFDSPSIRFIPVRDSLIAKGAIVNTNLLNGVGHTIDFPNRNSILTNAFVWIDSVNNSQVVGIQESKDNSNHYRIYPNPINKDASVILHISAPIKEQKATFRLFDLKGKQVMSFSQNLQEGENRLSTNFSTVAKGTYLLTIRSEEIASITKEIIIL
ncbi:MAG: T9SS type A sorting domain-containing protein [Flavobacteriales bacterium]|nr:T9SS type A sorting domain-containing protein [Flavobacteriales bacterium]